MTSPDFATDAPKTSATPLEDVDVVVEQLKRHKDAWVRTPLERRVQLLERCIDRTLAVSEEWVRAACRAKGLDANGPRGGEEALAGPMVTVRNLRLLKNALESDGAPPLQGLRKRDDGQWVAQVFPDGIFEKLMFAGFTAEVWIEPGHEASQGRIYREKTQRAEGEPLPPGKVSLVLGAGNVASIGPMDALYKLFVEDEVVIVKTNPVNAYLQPYWEEAFRPLIDEGVFYVVRGGVDVGSHLVHHPDIDTIHMTGSDATHDAIVWGGDPEERARRKASGERLVTKPISSELGAVTPVLVVPGPWSDSDIDFQARNIAGMIANNASFNCNAAKVVVTAKGWPQGKSLIDKLSEHLEATPPRVAYYPGAQRRYDGFLEHYGKRATPLGPRSPNVVPWTMIEKVPPKKGEYALTNEAFCGVVAHTELPASHEGAFLKEMVNFANDVVWGTLSCVIIIHPSVMKKHQRAFDDAIANLRYGGIAVNAFAGVIYALVSTSWGAYPGHTDEDIQSGRGVVHNGYLIDHPQKSVVYAPFRISPTPAWFADHKTAHELGPALTRFEADPGFVRLAPVVLAALRG